MRMFKTALRYTLYAATVATAYVVVPPVAAMAARTVVGYQVGGAATGFFAKTAGFFAKEHAGVMAFNTAQANVTPIASATIAAGEWCASRMFPSQEEVSFDHQAVDLVDDEFKDWVEVIPK